MRHNELLSDLFGAVYDYCDWQSFISSTIGYFEDDDDETVKAFSFMFSKYHTYTDDFNYQVRDLSKEEISITLDYLISYYHSQLKMILKIYHL